MTERSDGNGTPPTLGDEARAPETDLMSRFDDLERRAALDWVGDHLPEVRRSAYGRRSLYWTLGIGAVVGLAVYAGGYALRSWATTEPLMFVADALFTLGYALWTGVVVALFLQVIPETKRRGYRQLLEAYEAERGRASGEGDQGSGSEETTG
jgi:hypothetical protein